MRIGFLSFGHWRAAPGSQTRTAADALLQTIELAQAAEDIGVDGAFVRVHHFERQLASPFPLLSAIAARTSRIEIGTAVIDMRYENPLFLAAIDGAAVARTDPERTGVSGGLAIQPQSPGLRERIWWGSGTRATAQWTAQQGMNLMSSTLLVEDTGVPFDELQAEQIALYRPAWAEAGWEREPRISVSRSVFPIA